jgi:HEPN domain-containing protein
MNQVDLRLLAEERIKDAKALLDGQRWSFAYYAAGYAVECGLKSCVLARMIYTGWVFQEKWKAQECLTHDFSELVELAGLKTELDSAHAVNPGFVNRWTKVAMWDVTIRYQHKTQAEAEELYEAVTNDSDGVMKWLKNYW